MAKQADKEAFDELRAWCRPLGLEPKVFQDAVCVCWFKDSADKVGSIAVEERRPTTKTSWNRNFGKIVSKKVSVSTTCRKIINRFKRGMYIGWRRESEADMGSHFMIRTDEVRIRVPQASSPEELEIKLAATGWAGNPFGPSARPEQESLPWA
jgi:hypothetical protein